MVLVGALDVGTEVLMFKLLITGHDDARCCPVTKVFCMAGDIGIGYPWVAVKCGCVLLFLGVVCGATIARFRRINFNRNPLFPSREGMLSGSSIPLSALITPALFAPLESKPTSPTCRASLTF